MTHPAKRHSFLALLAALAALIAATPASADPGVSAKRAEAEQVLADIRAIDSELSHAVEAFNAAQVRLEEIREDQAANKRYLEIARSNLSQSQSTLRQRLLALYTSSDSSLAEILLGASSLEDLLARAETVDRVSEQDARVIREVRAFGAEVRERERELAAAHEEQERVVAERSARRSEIESQLAERERLLASIREEIERIQAAERERQQELAAQARQRASNSQPAEPSGESSGGGGDFGGSIGSPPPSQHGGVVGIAMQYLGIPYLWGGASPSTGFDCSGFVQYVYAQVGVSLPHNAAMQYGYGSPVSRSNLQAGDLVFFNGLGHNGIYIGGNQFIHSPHTGDVVKISSITGWYADTWVGGRRL
ncbi:MAG: C40 family peptidase [Actinobacteria bacterium]|nr:C40 family peptidase [Actinomycetota bacterium]